MFRNVAYCHLSDPGVERLNWPQPHILDLSYLISLLHCVVPGFIIKSISRAFWRDSAVIYVAGDGPMTSMMMVTGR